jgi:hypothetical protein
MRKIPQIQGINGDIEVFNTSIDSSASDENLETAGDTFPNDGLENSREHRQLQAQIEALRSVVRKLEKEKQEEVEKNVKLIVELSSFKKGNQDQLSKLQIEHAQLKDKVTGARLELLFYLCQCIMIVILFRWSSEKCA